MIAIVPTFSRVASILVASNEDLLQTLDTCTRLNVVSLFETNLLTDSIFFSQSILYMDVFLILSLAIFSMGWNDWELLVVFRMKLFVHFVGNLDLGMWLYCFAVFIVSDQIYSANYLFYFHSAFFCHYLSKTINTDTLCKQMSDFFFYILLF